MPTQAPIFAPFYDTLHFAISLSHKNFVILKKFDNAIACDLQFGPPLQSKILATPTYLLNVFFLTLITSD